MLKVGWQKSHRVAYDGLVITSCLPFGDTRANGQLANVWRRSGQAREREKNRQLEREKNAAGEV